MITIRILSIARVTPSVSLVVYAHQTVRGNGQMSSTLNVYSTVLKRDSQRFGDTLLVQQSVVEATLAQAKASFEFESDEIHSDLFEQAVFAAVRDIAH